MFILILIVYYILEVLFHAMMVRMHYAIHLLESISSFGAQWAYLAVLVTSFFEGLPFLGFFSPGGIAVALSGFLAKTGTLSFCIALLVATLAAFAGDTFGFALGQKYGLGFLRRFGQYFFMKEEHHIEKARTLILTHPGKALMFGRLYYLSRSISPFLAGASDVAIGTFLFYDFIGAFIWSILHIGVGYIFGQGFIAASKYLNYVILIAILCIVAIFYTYRFVNKRHHVFKKYHLYTLTINIVSIYVFAKCINDVMNMQSLYRFDRYVYEHMPYFWNGFLIKVFSGITVLGGFTCAGIFILLLFTLLVNKKKWYHTILAALSLSSAFISEALIKSITHIPRPPLPLVSTEYFSFPSGHTVLITIVGVLYFHCFRKSIESPRLRIIYGASIGTIIVLVGFSRIYLYAHWFTDVLGGVALGLFWVTFYILIMRAIQRIFPL